MTRAQATKEILDKLESIITNIVSGKIKAMAGEIESLIDSNFPPSVEWNEDTRDKARIMAADCFASTWDDISQELCKAVELFPGIQEDVKEAVEATANSAIGKFMRLKCDSRDSLVLNLAEAVNYSGKVFTKAIR